MPPNRSSLNPEQRRAHAQYAAAMSHVGRDGTARTQAARTAFRQQFADYADPDGRLAPAERSRQGEILWRAWWAYLRYNASRRTRALPLRDWLAKRRPTTVAEAAAR